ncbi:hypothetical protein [Lentzea albidocapillata]|nr:hypothetical protein [Lentzea albidocapillata]
MPGVLNTIMVTGALKIGMTSATGTFTGAGWGAGRLHAATAWASSS